MSYGELEYSIKEETSAARTAAVEAERELVEVRSQMISLDRSLVRSEKPPLGQRRHTMHAGHQLGRLVAGDDETFVRIETLGGRPIGLPPVGEDGRTLHDVVDEEAAQGVCGPIGDRCHPASAQSSGLFALDSHRYQGLLLSPTASS